MTSIRLIGDHASYHCGSAAVTQYLTKILNAHGKIVGDKDDYDILIVNGEGSMHHSSRGFDVKMQSLRNAIEDGKKAYLLNTLWQDNNHKYDDILCKLDGITTREVMSQKELFEKHNIRSSVFPDFSFFADINPKEKIIDFANSPVISDFYSFEWKCFIRLRGGRLSKHQFVDMRTMNWSQLVNSLKTASVFITGRHHGVYAACRARTPFVAMVGNADFKTKGILKSWCKDIPIATCASDIPAIMNWASKNRDIYDNLFDEMERQKPWQPDFTKY